MLRGEKVMLRALWGSIARPAKALPARPTSLSRPTARALGIAVSPTLNWRPTTASSASRGTRLRA